MWGGDWVWEEECGGGVSKSESTKGNTLFQYTTVTHHTHLQGPKGEESTEETQIETVSKASHSGRGGGGVSSSSESGIS